MTDSAHPYSFESVLKWLSDDRSDRPALMLSDDRHQVRHVSYGELVARARRAAAVLSTMGVGPGDRYHIHLPNCLAFLEAWLGGTLLGAVAVPTNPEASIDELAYVLSHSGCIASVTRPATLPGLEDTRWFTPDLEAIAVSGGRLAGASDHVDWDQAVESATPFDPTSTPPDAPAMILYTSGTTGWPKGAVITQRSLVHCGEVVSQWLRIGAEDRWLVSLPLFHGNSIYYAVMSALRTGASIALMSQFSASRWPLQARDSGATLASLFASQLRMLLAQPPRPSDSEHRIRNVIFAQGLKPSQLSGFERRFNVDLLQLYGMTETVAPVIVNPFHGPRNNSAMGQVAPWSRVRVVGESRQDVPKGAVGELLVGGTPGRDLMLKYFDDKHTTAEVFQDGWLSTGDYVRQDPDDYYFFVGRDIDMLKPEVENISALEIERTVEENWAVAECAVVGLPDPIHDVAIALYVVLIPAGDVTEDELFDWCRQHLADSKVPSSIHIVPDLPRTPVGKIDKRKLKAAWNPPRESGGRDAES